MNRAKPGLIPRAFSQVYQGLTDRLNTDIFVSGPLDPEIHPNPITVDECGASKFRGLWDTGASNSVISPKVAEICGMAPISLTEAHTANGIFITNVFLASIFLPNNVVFPSLRVTEGNLGDDVDVLIGMDIISQGDFAITNQDGNTLFSFRMPSITKIDFLKDSIPVVGRNDPCPCGSGKKYKKCHGSNVT